jgi:hypothetical protein
MNKIDDLIRLNKIQLGIRLRLKLKVYIDINIWIRLRECFVGSPKNREYQYLYELLIDLVNHGKVVCPISQRIFTELLKQDDYNSRINTAKVIDKLSQCFTILSEPEREQAELFYFVRVKILGQNNIIPVDDFIWSNVAYVFGTFIIEDENIPKKILDKLQKDIFNKLLGITLEEIIEKMGNKLPKQLLNRDISTFAINLGKMLANDKINSKKQLFLDELRGGLSVYKVTIEGFFSYIKNYDMQLYTELCTKGIKNTNDLLEIIFKDIKNDSIGEYLPSFYIQLCLHTMMRWDKEREFKSNDFDDFSHASSALPYYDYFFTEKPLSLMLNSSQFNLTKKYNKVVLNNISDIIQALKKIAI